MVQATSPARTRCAVRQNGRVRRHLHLTPTPTKGCISWCSTEGPHEVCEAEPITFDGGEICMYRAADGNVCLAILGNTGDWHGIDYLPRAQAQALMIGLAYMLARDIDGTAAGVAA